MRKFNYIILLAVAIFMFASCTSKKENKSREEQILEFRNELTAQDTTAMLRICDDAMELLKGKKIDQVLASLCEYDDSTRQVSPLSEAMNKRYTKIFKMFPVLSYERVYYSFMLEGCNDVKYEVTFATAEQTGSDKGATTMFMFNPVKIGDEWKLCVKTADKEFDDERQ